jgi:hypothetical protein
MKIIPLLLSLIACSCVNHPLSSERPTPKAVRFFTDYVNYDGPAPDSLPVFLSACRGDRASLDAIFSDYKRFGSGDNEAWIAVPGVLLEELGDQQFSSYASGLSDQRKVTVLGYLGSPGCTLDPDLRRLYPKTAALQEDLFAANPTARP